MELFLIRHGQSSNNADPDGERHHDPPLTEVGDQQAEHLAEWAKTMGFTRIVCSPFLRTLQTAERVRRATGVEAEIWVDVHEQGGCVIGPDPMSGGVEVDFEGLPGMTADEIRDGYPHFKLPAEIDHQGWWKTRPFEPLEQAQQRANAVAAQTREQFAHSDERIALVFHGMFKKLMINSFFDKTMVEHNWLAVAFNTGISRVTITPGLTRLSYYNSIAHLPEPLLTS